MDSDCLIPTLGRHEAPSPSGWQAAGARVRDASTPSRLGQDSVSAVSVPGAAEATPSTHF